MDAVLLVQRDVDAPVELLAQLMGGQREEEGGRGRMREGEGGGCSGAPRNSRPHAEKPVRPACILASPSRGPEARAIYHGFGMEASSLPAEGADGE